MTDSSAPRAIATKRQQIATGVRRLAGVAPPGRAVKLYANDTLIVSYPRSGNTWVRFMLANLRSRGGHVTLALMDREIPDIYKVSERCLNRLQQPRILKSHEYFDPRYERVVYLVRDPRDVLVSYYHYLIKVGALERGTEISLFVQDLVNPRSHRQPWLGAWGEHVGSWLGARHGDESFLLVRYEDLQADTVAHLGKIARFVGIGADESSLARAVKQSSSERMRNLEVLESQHWSATRGTLQDEPFIRTAAVGENRRSLAPETNALIEQNWQELMTELGYFVTTTD